MDKTEKCTLPSPCFDKPQPIKSKPSNIPHFLSPQGMQMPRELQPPPMYGPRGSTIPPRFLATHYRKNNNENDKRNNFHTRKFQHKKPSVCENCDIEFQSHEELKKHISEHKICGIDGCRFFGYPGIVEKHIEQQHTSGLYEKIKNLSTPEDIEKWRAERKKRYPTRANIELRQKAKEERKKRGEKLENSKSRFGKQSDRRQMPTENEKTNKNDKRKRKRNRNNPYNRKENLDKKEEVKTKDRQTEPVAKTAQSSKITNISENNDKEDLPVFRGTANFTDYKTAKVKKVEKNVLSNLVGMYGSEDDETTEDEMDEEMQGNVLNESPIKKSVTTEEKIDDNEPSQNLEITQQHKEMSHEKQNTDEIIDENEIRKESSCNIKVQNTNSNISQPFETLAHENADTTNEIADEDLSDEAPEEIVINKSTDMPEPVPTKRPPKKGNSKTKPKVIRKSGLDYSKLRLRRQNTMLAKLLASDIRHERNILLQCTRFVVENNFFGIGQKSEQS